MAILEVTVGQIGEILSALGICPGNGLLVHSAIQFLGRPVGGVKIYYQALCSACNIVDLETRTSATPLTGTLAVPAFNFAFARGEPYDPDTTPSQGMGVFSEWVRQQPDTLRTFHPMQSLAVVGRYAAPLVKCDTPSAFDPGSAFERLLELDFKLLLLGADVQAVSMVHYSEQRAGVPYRYWKEFEGPVRTHLGLQTRRYRMFVRDLEMDPHLDLRPIQAVLQARGQWASAPLNYGKVSLCRLRDFTAAADELLATDPWALVSNRKEAQARG